MFKFILAHESRAWLLHYSPLVLKDVIHEQYFQHHLLLVESIYLLLKDIVTKDDIVQSSKLLKKYCFLFSSFYGTYILKHLTRNVTLVTGVRHMSANVHGLLHLPNLVADMGPLWAHSCFPYENSNGELLKLFHGSQGVDKQVIDIG